MSLHVDPTRGTATLSEVVTATVNEAAVRAQCLWCGHVDRVLPKRDEETGGLTFVGPACRTCKKHRWSRHVG